MVPDPPGLGGDGGEAVGGEVPLQAAWGQAGLEGQGEEGSCREPGAGEGVQQEGDHRLGPTCQRHWHDSHSGDRTEEIFQHAVVVPQSETLRRDFSEKQIAKETLGNFSNNTTCLLSQLLKQKKKNQQSFNI